MDYDDILNIDTSEENQQFPSIIHHHRYEPTDYHDLEQLVNVLPYNDDDILIDFGSGLCRVPIYMNYRLGIETIGVEINKALHLKAKSNIRAYHHLHKPAKRVTSINQNVKDYQFTGNESILFFFNPFSSVIFKSLMMRFLKQTGYHGRKIVVLYYAKHEYIDIMSQLDVFKEIIRIELANFQNDQHDQMIIYEWKVSE